MSLALFNVVTESASFFAHRVAVIATMHRKEQAIAPLLKQELGMDFVVPDSFNTDRFGTFTGDVDRPANQIETARLKAQAALELTGETVAIASEGSFGPHPSLPYLPCNREIVLLLDRQHNLEIIGEAISTETNFSQKVISTQQAAQEFAEKAGFPEHGLVIAPAASSPQSSPAELIKGITTDAQLMEAVTTILANHGQAHLQTDMRAMHNPTRLQVIQQATQDLIQAAKRTCPSCQMPGFAVSDRTSGLPCALCHHPTDLLLAEIYTCQICDHQAQKFYPNGVEMADPMYCAYCNP